MKRIQKKWLSMLLCLLIVWCGAGQWVLADAPRTLLPGGMAFGVRFACDGLIVVGFSEVVTESGSCMPAYDAGLRINDRIHTVNGVRVKSSEDFIRQIENGGTDVEIVYERDGLEYTTRLKPVYSTEETKYKTGMWLRDTTAGIGTVTYIDAETGVFAGLGHGICESGTGELLPLGSGTVLDVSITGVSKGVPGRPGELKGQFTEKTTGTLLKNTPCGVYGKLDAIPYDRLRENAMPVAEKDELCLGEAYIWCTLSGNQAEKFTVSITELSAEEEGKFAITVTDPALIEKTGGIVQGMSGSPVIQNGRIVGAVTHVLINDPTRGYGIFIENMLEAAEQ